jgi:hypothetical protein
MVEESRKGQMWSSQQSRYANLTLQLTKFNLLHRNSRSLAWLIVVCFIQSKFDMFGSVAYLLCHIGHIGSPGTKIAHR